MYSRKWKLSPRLVQLEDRLTPAGALDTAFSGDGRATLDFGNKYDRANAVVVQPDGKIVVAGAWDGGFSDFAIARFNADSSLDKTFGVGSDGFTNSPTGKMNVHFGDAITSGVEVATSVALQTDGKIVVAGYSNKDTTGPSSDSD